MATISYLSAIQTTQQSHTGDTSAYVVPGTTVTLAANTTYLIFAFGLVNGNSDAGNFGISLAIESIGYNGHTIEPMTTTSRYSYFSFYEHATGGSTETAKIWIWTNDSADTVYADQVGVIALDVSDWSKGATSSDDYNYTRETSEQTVTSETPGGSADYATTTFRTSTASDVWLLSGYIRCRHTAGRSFRASLPFDNSVVTRYSEQESEDDDDRYVHHFFHPLTVLADQDHTVGLHCWKTASQGTAYVYDRASLAINLTRIFSDFAYQYTEGTTALGSDWTNLQTVSDTGTGDDAFVFTGCLFEPTSAGEYGKFRQQLDNTDNPATQTSDAYEMDDSWESTDRIPFAMLGVESSLSTSSHTLDLDGLYESSGSNASRRFALLLSSTLVSTGDTATAGQAEIEFVGLDATAVAKAKTTSGQALVDFVCLDATCQIQVEAIADQADLEWIGLDCTAAGTVSATAGQADLEWIGLDSTAIAGAITTAGQADIEWIGLDAVAVSDALATAGQAEIEWIGLDSTAAADVLIISGQADLEWIGLDCTAQAAIGVTAGQAETDWTGLDGRAVVDVLTTADQADVDLIGLDPTAIASATATTGQAEIEWIGLDPQASLLLVAYAGQAETEWTGLDGSARVEILVISGQADLEWVGLDCSAISDIQAMAGQAETEWTSLDCSAILAGEVITTTARIDWIGLSPSAVSDSNVATGQAGLEWIGLDCAISSGISATAGQAGLEWIGLDCTTTAVVSVNAAQADIEWIGLDATAEAIIGISTLIAAVDWIAQDTSAVAAVRSVAGIATFSYVGLVCSVLLPDEAIPTYFEIPAEMRTVVEVRAEIDINKEAALQY